VLATPPSRKCSADPFPTLDIAHASVALSGGATPYTLDLDVDNLGDGDTPATTATLTLTRTGSPDVPLQSFQLDPLGHGQLKQLTFHFALPPQAGGSGGVAPRYSLKITLDTAHQLQEYDETNNTLVVPLPY
jgi:hypothetical protein